MAYGFSDITVRKLQMVLDCNPRLCKGENCPLYDQSNGYCSALDLIDTVKTVAEMKFEGKNLNMTKWGPLPEIIPTPEEEPIGTPAEINGKRYNFDEVI